MDESAALGRRPPPVPLYVLPPCPAGATARRRGRHGAGGPARDTRVATEGAAGRATSGGGRRRREGWRERCRARMAMGLGHGKKRGRSGRRRRAPCGGGVPSPLLYCRRLPVSAARVSMPPPGGQPWVDHPPRLAAWRRRPPPRRPQTAGTGYGSPRPAARGGRRRRRSGRATAATNRGGRAWRRWRSPHRRHGRAARGGGSTDERLSPSSARERRSRPHVADFVVVDS
ncbi:hypothetical protein I4F81_010034 [Pyropia yezoensis]|uniref:Uncharacterized protein n=1 Tax=Pyropia yezoensis TaxID=2788 RepID=A0ACC3CBI2_PYRYE|nr:hypothetical protein I4F81_010034 [Neopyropia yezoensis]